MHNKQRMTKYDGHSLHDDCGMKTDSRELTRKCLNIFHENWVINVASNMLTFLFIRSRDLVFDFSFTPMRHIIGTKRSTNCHENWNINVSRMFKGIVSYFT
ncbi:hypothetical protein DPMN_112538 [Dreissena polymorpha]|uniref:Uncharacterized protein n=1 Tax=Dreissena polymorpha TaxID=45954 RepID=A0A9D4QQZ8_DREPO|nr:hypothetical protein DPMN_112538 [Dreissena polymorpha]